MSQLSVATSSYSNTNPSISNGWTLPPTPTLLQPPTSGYAADEAKTMLGEAKSILDETKRLLVDVRGLVAEFRDDVIAAGEVMKGPKTGREMSSGLNEVSVHDNIANPKTKNSSNTTDVDHSTAMFNLEHKAAGGARYTVEELLQYRECDTLRNSEPWKQMLTDLYNTTALTPSSAPTVIWTLLFAQADLPLPYSQHQLSKIDIHEEKQQSTGQFILPRTVIICGTDTLLQMAVKKGQDGLRVIGQATSRVSFWCRCGCGIRWPGSGRTAGKCPVFHAAGKACSGVLADVAAHVLHLDVSRVFWLNLKLAGIKDIKQVLSTFERLGKSEGLKESIRVRVVFGEGEQDTRRGPDVYDLCHLSHQCFSV